MIFCSVLDAAIQLSAYKEHRISKQSYEISIVQEVHISRLELLIWSPEFVIFFSKVYIGDLRLRFGSFLLDSCNPNLSLTDKFSVHIFLTMKI